MKRRKFLRLSATASVIGLTPLDLQAALTPLKAVLDCPDVSNRKLVLINLAGGNDGLNTIIPLNQYDIYANLRPSIKIPNSGINTCIPLDTTLGDTQQIGIHPTLTGFKSLYDKGRMRVIQSVGYPSQNKSHFKSTDLYLTGNDGNSMNNGVDTGWIGRFMERYYSENLADSYPLAVQIGSLKTSLGFHGEEEHGLSLNISGQDPAGFYSVLSGLGGLPPTNIPNSDYGTELEYIKTTDALSNQYAEVISDSFNSGTNAISYPDTDLANQLKTVARLISGDLGSKVYMVRISGFDTHNSQINGVGDPYGKHANLLNELSEAVNTFISDLDQQKIADDVVALTFSEFGRKAGENGNFGTDHGEIAPMFVFGKPVKGGVSGLNPELSEATQDNNFQIQTVQYDYRQTFATLLQDFLGAPDSIIDAAFLDHTLNETFTDKKIKSLIRNKYAVSDFCRAGGEEVVTNPEENDWVAYPNPVQDELNLISPQEFSKTTVNIYKLKGRLVKSRVSTSNKIRIPVKNLRSGNYFVEILSDNKREVHLIVKL